MGLILVFGFWLGVVKLWIADGPRTPIMFIVAWFGGGFALNLLGVHSAIGAAYTGILAVSVWILAKSRS